MLFTNKPVEIHVDAISLSGDLTIPKNAQGIVLFAHGSGSSRFSPRNQRVASICREKNLATLLFDLLTSEEEFLDSETGQYRFDIELLTQRLVLATDWILKQDDVGQLPLGYFGASTGAAAAIKAGVLRSDVVKAVVSRGGRPDLAGESLPDLKAPVLLIVGGRDFTVIQLNVKAMERIVAEKELAVIPGATHLFEEPGALDHAARLAAAWFQRFLRNSGQKL